MALSPRQWAIFGGSAVVGYALARYGVNPIVPVQIVGGYVTNAFARGSALSSSTLVGGVVQEAPEDLRVQADAVLGQTTDPDTYALARMGRSEGVDGMEYRMHVALNDLRELQAQYGRGVYSSISALMLHSKNAAADGHFSAQRLGKRYSTAHDPFVGDYELAAQVRADDAAGIDPTGGAVKFVDKDGPLYVNGQVVDYDTFVQTWAAEGLSPSNLSGASSNFVVFTRTA